MRSDSRETFFFLLGLSFKRKKKKKTRKEKKKGSDLIKFTDGLGKSSRTV
jgi:hypothetical protein